MQHLISMLKLKTLEYLSENGIKFGSYNGILIYTFSQSVKLDMPEYRQSRWAASDMGWGYLEIPYTEEDHKKQLLLRFIE